VRDLSGDADRGRRGRARRGPCSWARGRSGAGLAISREARGPGADRVGEVRPQLELERSRRSDAREHEHVRRPCDVAARASDVRSQRAPDRGDGREQAPREAKGRGARDPRLLRVAGSATVRNTLGTVANASRRACRRPRRTDRRLVLGDAQARETIELSGEARLSASRPNGGQPQDLRINLEWKLARVPPWRPQF